MKVNEVESNGDTEDWVELYNTSSQAVNLSGYVFRDNDNTRGYTIPSGTTIPANGYLVLAESAFGFGLGAADEARLFAPGGVTLVDSYSWTTHASTTYGRCPNGTGAFATTTVSTRGTANNCAGDISYLAWPGDATVTTVDAANTFGSNMSGLSYQAVAGQATGVVWAVKNGPGTLYRLTYLNGQWTPRASRAWTNGKALRYPDGTGDVDAEGVVARGTAIYVSSERNNSASGTSRMSILRYSVATETGATLIATHEWNVTAALPAVGANLGLEGITFIPDAFLTARSFYDESKGRAYNPADYANHEGGLFFVAVEGTGMVHAFALDHVGGSYTRIASFNGGYSGAMDLAFDAELGQLWVVCDDTCQGRTAVHRIDTQSGSPTLGRFTVRERFERPTGMPNTNNEGFTFAPLAECVNGRRLALWSDDNQLSGFALRQGSLTCSPF
ncbi:MAG: lamin tail domain-containing protein [Gemmatimonadaceae bacterium]|nr:lamin tail domain-containing protein [Gemmatimonadaceae bacterium]